jgi:hypothetical protein
MEDKDRRSSDTIYDGVGQGSLHSRVSLNADLAVAELVIAAICSPEVINTIAAGQFCFEKNFELKHFIISSNKNLN